MKAKEYKLFDSVMKTAQKNNLIVGKQNLFDFSLLDSIRISGSEKEYIIDHDIRYINGIFNKFFCSANYYNTKSNSFSACIEQRTYHVYKVFSVSGKLLYKIFILTII